MKNMERNGADWEAAGIREMDELFRRTDFSAGVPGLEDRIWQRIRARMPERELGEDELEEMAAAGGREVCCTNGCALKCVNNL